MDHDKGRTPPGNVAQASLPWRRPAMALMLLLGATASAHAQISGGRGHPQGDPQQQQQTPPKPPKAPTPPPPRPQKSPRVESGGGGCKAREVLLQYPTTNPK